MFGNDYDKDDRFWKQKRAAQASKQKRVAVPIPGKLNNNRKYTFLDYWFGDPEWEIEGPPLWLFVFGILGLSSPFIGLLIIKLTGDR